MEESNESIEQKILELAQSKPDGITNNEIKATLGSTPPAVWTKVINTFLKNGYVKILLI